MLYSIISYKQRHILSIEIKSRQPVNRLNVYWLPAFLLEFSKDKQKEIFPKDKYSFYYRKISIAEYLRKRAIIP
ncbi:hypothetical protein A3781_16440 [Bacillus badius]|nr:hypothetical protein A3781_16440 [Bacillus badius]